MKQKNVIGIDISKSKVDCAVIDFTFKIEYELIITNKEKKLKSFIKDMLKLLKINADELLICCENTGIYNRPLEIVCSDIGVDLWVEHALKIKRASTDMRGKDDRKDAVGNDCDFAYLGTESESSSSFALHCSGRWN